MKIKNISKNVVFIATQSIMILPNQIKEVNGKDKQVKKLLKMKVLEKVKEDKNG